MGNHVAEHNQCSPPLIYITCETGQPKAEPKDDCLSHLGKTSVSCYFDLYEEHLVLVL
jgi:hypothetical protein